MNIADRMKNLYTWYSRLDVQFNIIKYTRNRETVFLVPSYESKELKMRSTRMLKIHSTQHLNYVIDALNMFKRNTPYNFYVSLAEFKNGIPNQDLSNNMRNRDNTLFYKNYWLETDKYDLLIDIDAKDHKFIDFAVASSKILIEKLNEFGVKYELRFSGRGFHFYIPITKLAISYDPLEEKSFYFKMNFLLKMLNSLYSEMIDTQFIYTPYSVAKIPFTVANYLEEQYICLPIDNINNFDLSDYRLEKILNMFKDTSFYSMYQRPIIDREQNTLKFLEFYNYIFTEFNSMNIKIKKR